MNLDVSQFFNMDIFNMKYVRGKNHVIKNETIIAA